MVMELPALPYDILENMGSIGVAMHPGMLPLDGRDGVSVSLTPLDDVGKAILAHAGTGDTISDINELCRLIKGAFPYGYDGLAAQLDVGPGPGVGPMARRVKEYAEDRRPWVFKVPLTNGSARESLKLPASGRRIATALQRIGAETVSDAAMGAPEFIYADEIKPDSVPWPDNLLELNQLSQKLEPYLLGKGEKEVNRILALLEAQSPATSAQILELCARNRQYRLLTEEGGTLLACGKAAMALEDMDDREHSDEEIRQYARRYLKERGGKNTSLGYIIEDKDSPWGQPDGPGDPARMEPGIFVFVSHDECIDSIHLPMKPEELERVAVNDDTNIRIDDATVLSAQCSCPEIDAVLQRLSGTEDVRALNRLAQSLDHMDPVFLDELRGQCASLGCGSVEEFIDAVHEIDEGHRQGIRMEGP